MGNRAVIAFKDEHFEEDMCPAIYLHWNGSRESVEGFLKAAEKFGIRGDDSSYCIARLTQVIANAIGGTLSLGVGCYGNFGDPGDNGVYWIKDWEIIEHSSKFLDNYEYEDDEEYNTEKFTSTLKETLEANKGIHRVGAKEI